MLVLLASVQSYGVVAAQFALDRESIAERYCVNRDRPELHCDGACELSRRLAQQNEREHEVTLLGVALSATFWLAPAPRLAEPASEAVAVPGRPAGRRAPRGVPADVFHPPQAA